MPTVGIERAWPLRLDEVFAAEGARLLVSARKMTGSRLDAEDLLQDAFVRALARPDAFVDRSDKDVVGWLWLVMRRKWRDQTELRRNGERPLDEVLGQNSGEYALPDDQHERAERDWELAVTYEALARLGPKHRTAMVLLARGYGEQEAADRAGVTRRTMREWRRDARRSLGLFGERLANGTVCEKWQSAISSLADGEFGDGARRQALDAHLRHCRHCRGRLADIRAHAQFLQGALPVAAVAGMDDQARAAAGVVQIGQQTLHNLGTPRGVISGHSGMVDYLIDHWRLAASAAVATVALLGVISHSASSVLGGAPPARTDRAVVVQAPSTTPIRRVPPDARTTPAQPSKPPVAVRRASTRTTGARPAARQTRVAARPVVRTAVPVKTYAPPPAPPAAQTGCRTAECLFAP